ncbi:MAG TPA: N-acetylglucosamine-6-phosphate deacetylase [Xanthobacteraceae bacterium]|nr:N-acetylglucosamine-6-phosphate deacetylase [Xanthobacteraceae bacterium]
MSDRHAIAADHVFDGQELRRDAAVIVEEGTVAAVVPRAQLPGALAVDRLPDGIWLAPGFIDIQVNGGGDVLFNDMPTAEGIRAIVRAHRRFGTTGLLPTLISDTREKMATAIAAVQAVIDREPGVLGIHLEGPFLSQGKPGVHAPGMLRRPEPADLALVAAPRKGATLMTLAPEEVPEGFVRDLAAAGVRVSLGHSMATYAQARAAMEQGLTGFTHLFNAMRPLGSRDPGPIAAALEASDAYYGLIVDGVHVDPAVLRLALRGAGHPILVTDAMPPVGGTRGGFMLYGNEISVREGRCERADGTLAGSALTMADAVRNCVRWLDVPLTDALRYASRNPAEFLGLGDRLGKLVPKSRADLVAFAPDGVEVQATWVAGRKQPR